MEKIEIHLCSQDELYGGKRCFRTWGNSPNYDFLIFVGIEILGRGIDHLIFDTKDLFDVVSRLNRAKIKFFLTGS